MAYETLCMYCFEDRESKNICPHCGRDARAAVPQVQMLPGTLIYHDRFLVGRALGQDASGIVYAAFDTRKNNKMRIREYMPRDCAERLPDGSVVPIAGMEEKFDRGMEKLRASVEDVEDPRRRHFYFEEYGTAYIAQRKSTQVAAKEAAPQTEEKSGVRSLGLILGIAAAVVVIAVIAVIALINSVEETPVETLQNRTPDPTASPSATVSWAPQETPTPTPNVVSTFAPLVSPNQSWMDWTSNGSSGDNVDPIIEGTDTATAIPGATQAPRVTQAPTAAPTLNPAVTPFSNTVASNSTTESITALQRRLAQLGWLGSSNVSGTYDSATRQAVRDFQTYVNENYNPAERLTVDGIAGPKTQQWLYGTNAVRPTATPTAAVTPDPNQELTIDKNSSKADIRSVQRKLITLGLLDSGDDDGVYSTKTTTAVKKFQARVNQLQGYTVLELTGTVDPTTNAYLDMYVEIWEELRQATAVPAGTPTRTPTSRPTNTPTPAPDVPETVDTVDRNSPRESIQFLQQELIQVGLLSPGSDDGVFGNGTQNALIRFQEWVNDTYGQGTVAVTGQGDYLTLQYLETAAADGMQATATSTPEPTAEVTPAPEPTDVPDEPEDNQVVDRNSDTQSIRYVQEQLNQLGLINDNGVDGIFGGGTTRAAIAFQRYVNSVYGAGTVNEEGRLDAVTLGYLEEAVANGVRINADGTIAATATPGSVNRVDLDLTLSNTEVVNGVYVATGDTIEFDWGASGEVTGYYIYIENSSGSVVWSTEATAQTHGRFNRADLKEDEIYTIEIGTMPVGGSPEDMSWTERRFTFSTGAASAVETPEPTTEVTEAPSALESVSLSINGTTTTGLVEIDNDARISWQARGDVKSYSVTITDSQGNRLIDLPETTQTSGTVRRSQLKEGEVYTITISAVPEGEGNIVWTEARFSVPSTSGDIGDIDAPTEEEPTEAPEVVMPVSAPEISINATSYSQNGVRYLTGSSATFSWSVSGDVREYRIYMRSDNGTRTSTDQTISSSKRINLASLAPGQYRLYVGAVPDNYQSDDDIVWSSVSFAIPPQIEADDGGGQEEEEGEVPLDPIEEQGTSVGSQLTAEDVEFGAIPVAVDLNDEAYEEN